MISQKLSMKLEPCNSTQGAPFQYIINIKLYLYLGSFCSSVRGIIIQTKTLIAQSIEFSFRLLFAWVIKVIVKLSQWNLPHIQSNVDVKLSIFFFFLEILFVEQPIKFKELGFCSPTPSLWRKVFTANHLLFANQHLSVI